MKMYERPNASWISSRRLMTWAWMETSRAETGSSQMTISGLRARDRAMPMRWRWPPEN